MPLTCFTSSVPMRGLMLEIIKLRSDDTFIIYFNSQDKNMPYMKFFFNKLSTYNNTELIFDNYSKKFANFKALLGFSNYLNIKVNADLYISPGNVDFFGKGKLPLINILADLSSIRNPEISSMPWHGTYIYKNLLKYSVKYSSRIICISQFTQNDLHALYPQTKEKTQVIYSGIDPEWFDLKYDNIEIDGFTNHDIGYWIWCGYISKRKNILNLLKAYKLLKTENKSIPKILFIGQPAPNQSFLYNYIRKNLYDSVKIISHLDLYKLKYLVYKSRGLVFPSFYEGFGLPIIEAYSQGIPVMHSNISSLPEIANGLGISCDPYNIESIKTALIHLLNNNLNEHEKEKRRNWANNFTYNNAALKFSEIIDGLQLSICDSKMSL